MFNELKITNNGDNTYSFLVTDYVDEKSMKKYDVTADKLKGISFEIGSGAYHGGKGFPCISSIPNKYCNLKVNADFHSNTNGEYYKIILKDEPKNVDTYNDVIEHLKNGKELIFTKSSGVFQKFRVHNGILQDFNFGRNKWEDRVYFPQWSDLIGGQWAVVL